MTKLAQVKSTPTIHPQAVFRGAWIDSDGREIIITERMIQEACRDLEAVANSIYPKIIGRRNLNDRKIITKFNPK